MCADVNMYIDTHVFCMLIVRVFFEAPIISTLVHSGLV